MKMVQFLIRNPEAQSLRTWEGPKIEKNTIRGLAVGDTILGICQSPAELESVYQTGLQVKREVEETMRILVAKSLITSSIVIRRVEKERWP